jgi:hypothetical protein
MTGDEARQVYEAMLPQVESDRLGEEHGVIGRRRALPLGMVVRALVILTGPVGGASQADVWRSSLACAVTTVARSACAYWFDEPWERCMGALAEPVWASAQVPQADLWHDGLVVCRWHDGHIPRGMARDVAGDL